MSVSKIKTKLNNIKELLIRKKIILSWYIITLGLFFLFIYFTPLDVYNEFAFEVSLSESLICAFFFSMGIFKIESLEDFYNLNEPEEEETLMSIFGPILSVASFVFFFIFIYIFLSTTIETELKTKEL